MTAPKTSAYTIRLLLVSHFISIFLSFSAGQCFWPDGQPEKDERYLPCLATNGTQLPTCCRQGDICLDGPVCRRSPLPPDIEPPAAPRGAPLDDGDRFAQDPSFPGVIAVGLPFYRPICAHSKWFEDSTCRNIHCVDGSLPAHDALHGDQVISQCDEPHEEVFFCQDGFERYHDCPHGRFIFTVSGWKRTVGIALPTDTSTPTTLLVAPPQSTAFAPGSGEPPQAMPEPAPEPSPPVPGEVTPPPTLPDATEVAAPAPPQGSGGDDDRAAKVPLAVGGAIGGLSLLAASVLGFFVLRHMNWFRRKPGAARAESPPPIELHEGRWTANRGIGHGGYGDWQQQQQQQHYHRRGEPSDKAEEGGAGITAWGRGWRY